MTQSNKEDLMKKWAPILESTGITGSRAEWMSKYVHQHGIMSNANIPTNLTTPTQSFSESMSDTFPSILPMAMKVAAQTIGLDLVSVQPMSGPGGSFLHRLLIWWNNIF